MINEARNNIVFTMTAEALLLTLQQTRDKAGLSAVSLPNGMGKTMTIRHFMARNPGGVFHLELNRKLAAHQVIDLLLAEHGSAARPVPMGDLFDSMQGRTVALKPLGRAHAERALAQWFMWRSALAGGEAARMTFIIDGAQWLSNPNEASALVETLQKWSRGNYAGIALIGDDRFILPGSTWAGPRSEELTPKTFSLHMSLIDRLDNLWRFSPSEIPPSDFEMYLRERHGVTDTRQAAQIANSVFYGKMRPSLRSLDRFMAANRPNPSSNHANAVR